MLFAKYNKAKDEIERVRRRLQNIRSGDAPLNEINEKQISYAFTRLHLYEHVCRTHLVQRDRTRFIRYPVGLMHDASLGSLPSSTTSPLFVPPALFS